MTARLDVEMVRRGLARSRGQARELVDAGLVLVDGRPIGKPSYAVGEAASVELREPGPVWVSRAAGKLVGAFAAYGPCGLTATGKRCVDVGASTGGFTQVLLHEGAAEVVAVDVGRGQLAEVVARDDRVVERGAITVRGLTAADIGGPADLLVADLSFISLTLVMQDLAGLLTPVGDAVMLVKPQFEVGRQRLGKRGVVTSPADRAWAITDVARAASEAGLSPLGLEASPVPGSTGNAEYLLWATRRDQDRLSWETVVATADRLSLDV